MTGFAKYIENTYNLPLHLSDQKALDHVSDSEQENLRKKIERKYNTGSLILEKLQSPVIEKTIKKLLEQSPANCLKALSRINDLLQLWQSYYLNDALFEKYHQKVIKNSQTHEKLMELAQQAQEQAFEPEDFQQYLNSGLFDEGIYTLKRGPSQEEVKEALEAMRLDIDDNYQLALCEKDEDFILNNKVSNPHIITQIVVPKYRLAHEIIELLGGHYMDEAIQAQLESGLNEGVPILKRIKALAEWYSDGYLSQPLVKKFHHTLIHDLDELEAFFLFLEKISELISKDRAIHYMEMGLYEVFEEERFASLLKTEQQLYDINDDVEDSVREYIQIMKTPAASKSMNTNRRLAQCFGKFVHAIDLLVEHHELLEIKKYVPKLQQFQKGFAQLFNDYHQKNPRLPAPPPYKAIEHVRPFSRMYFNIESETLLRMSLMVAKYSQSELEHWGESEDPVLAEAAKRIQVRLQVVQEALANPKDATTVIGQLIPLQQTHMFQLNRYLNKKK